MLKYVYQNCFACGIERIETNKNVKYEHLPLLLLVFIRIVFAFLAFFGIQKQTNKIHV